MKRPREIVDAIVESASRTCISNLAPSEVSGVAHATEFLHFSYFSSSRHSVLSGIIPSIVRITAVPSKEASRQLKHGYNFSTDAIEPCKWLLNDRTSLEDLREYIIYPGSAKKRRQGALASNVRTVPGGSQGVKRVGPRHFRQLSNRSDYKDEIDKVKTSIRVPHAGEITNGLLYKFLVATGP
jgi:hypothetical protein